MANAAKKTETSTKPAAPKPAQAPAGYRRQTQDPVGFWEFEKGPIHFIPRSVKLFDGNIEKIKPSILIIGELLDPCTLSNKDGDVNGVKGDIVGVWYKPGMKPIVNLCDAKVWMQQNGEIETGKPNAMKLFDVQSPGPNKRFTLVFDDRKESAGVRTVFADARKVTAPVADDDGEDIPF